MTDRNRDGSKRFLAGRPVFVRMHDGTQCLGKVNEYDEDGGRVAVRMNGDDWVFSVERLWEDIGFRPAYSFAGAVEQTYEWFRREKRDATVEFDFSWEDDLLQRIGKE